MSITPESNRSHKDSLAQAKQDLWDIEQGASLTDDQQVIASQLVDQITYLNTIIQKYVDNTTPILARTRAAQKARARAVGVTPTDRRPTRTL